MQAGMRDFVRVLGVITSALLVLCANSPVPSQAQGTDSSASKARASGKATSESSLDGQDARMASFQARAKARWRAQQIVARKAEAAYQTARLEREIAEIRVLEYQEAGLPQDVAAADVEVALAESDLSRATDRLAWANRMFAKGFVGQAQRVSEELSLKKAQFTLAQARTKKLVVAKLTNDRTIKDLQSEVEKARTEELARKSTWELEKSRESELEGRAVRAIGSHAKPGSH
jgi:hypothetical protein